MERLVLCLCAILILFHPKDNTLTGAAKYAIPMIHKESTDSLIIGNLITDNLTTDNLTTVNTTTDNTAENTTTENTTTDNVTTDNIVTDNRTTDNILTAMDALDLVKVQYADNFEKVYIETKYNNDKKEEKSEYHTDAEYYYQLPDTEYYLAYEGQGVTEQDYLIHLYEFVLDEPDLKIGHFVTYGWYTVDKVTGIIKEQTQY